jgi:hypothetical protein
MSEEINNTLLIATPFIKVDEAKWLIDNLRTDSLSPIELQILYLFS